MTFHRSPLGDFACRRHLRLSDHGPEQPPRHPHRPHCHHQLCRTRGRRGRHYDPVPGEEVHRHRECYLQPLGPLLHARVRARLLLPCSPVCRTTPGSSCMRGVRALIACAPRAQQTCPGFPGVRVLARVCIERLHPFPSTSLWTMLTAALCTLHKRFTLFQDSSAAPRNIRRTSQA